MSRKGLYFAGAALALLATFGAARLRFDVDPLNLLPADLPVVEGLKLYQRNFTDSRELILTVRSPDAEKTQDAAKALATALRAETNLTTSVIWQPAWQEQPAQAGELIGYLWLNQPPSDFAEMAQRMTGTNIAATLADAREQIAASMSPSGFSRPYDPYNLFALPEGASGGAGATFGEGRNFFESEDGTFRIVFVKARPDISSYRAGIAWLDSIRDIIKTLLDKGDIPYEVSIHLTGSPAFVAEISASMEHDMTASVGITSFIIAVLFWFFHRRLVPMLWLLALLGVILACTLSLGGLLFGTVNVVSLGFAAILLGLAVDYGVVHYQEAMASPTATIPEIRRAIGPSIFWAAVTTISAFLVLNFGGLPGLAQLGSLVALGVALSAVVMLFVFLPPLFRDRAKMRAEGQTVRVEPAPSPVPAKTKNYGWVLAASGFVVLGAVLVLCFGVPKVDRSGDALRPQHSPAFTAMDEIKTNMTRSSREPLWLIVRGQDEAVVGQKLEIATRILAHAVSNGVVSNFTLPAPLWPRIKNQTVNRALATDIVSRRDELRKAALDAGFATNGLVLTDAIFNTWLSALGQPGVFWPTNEMSQWVMGKATSRSQGGFLAVGLITSAGHPSLTETSLAGLSAELSKEGLILSGWDLLGPSILRRVQQNLWMVVTPMVVLVLLSLWLAFKRPAEIILSLATLAVSGLCLLAVMQLAGWSWNLLNLMALPLMLGSGVDYSIFMQLALRRHHGDWRLAHRSVGRALLLCGGTAVAGFGSLALSTNAGMASLGKVCAVGIGFNMLISVLLLPVWWKKLAGTTPPNDTPSNPSSLYRPGPWRLGLALTRILPPGVCSAISRGLAGLYWTFAGKRREIVVQNLMPALRGDRIAAQQTGRRLIRNFTSKIADLMRYESGLPIEQLFAEWSGWEHFEKAREQKRGILLLTPHLGNWEFGGPLLTRRGVKLQVITLAEPGGGFTELRRAARSKWDIDTLVIGEDPFGFVEIIRRLEGGAAVAMLIDRPPPASRVMVELFGQPFAASIAPAELARASGCILLPVYLPHTSQGYAAHSLPPIEYDRVALRERDARRALTQKIITAFEPVIRQHLDQWYHFVPVWPEKAPPVNLHSP